MSDKLQSELTRRDFLKLGGAAAAGLFFRKPIEKLDRIGTAVEQERSFETDKAIYTPFFEEHSHRNSDERILAVKPDCLFVEFVAKSDEVSAASPLSILMSEGVAQNTSAIFGVRDVETGRFFSDELLLGLESLGANVSVEGIGIPEDLEQKSDLIQLVTPIVAGSAAAVSLGIAIEKLIKGKNLDKGDATRIMASALASLWASSDEVAGFPLGLSYSTDTDENKPQIMEAQRLANRLYSAISFTHPEDVIVFMRNIFMALKLISLADLRPNEKIGVNKMHIAFRAGAAHGAVSDMVRLGKDITTTFLDIYPDSVLRNVVEYNTTENETLEKRIEDFCKTLVISVHEGIRDNKRARYMVDKNLKEYLGNRLLKTPVAG
jgi:hypothetical protein